MLIVLCGGFECVQCLCLLGRMEPDLDQFEWADEAVADPKTWFSTNTPNPTSNLRIPRIRTIQPHV